MNRVRFKPRRNCLVELALENEYRVQLSRYVTGSRPAGFTGRGSVLLPLEGDHTSDGNTHILRLFYLLYFLFFFTSFSNLFRYINIK